MRFGAHISTVKPFSDSVIRASEIGCECMQIFANPPQRWNPTILAESEIQRFKELNNKVNINPVVIHSIYLNNFASENPFYYETSIKSLIDDMKKAKSIGAIGANTHLGSTKGRDFKEVLNKVVSAIKDILRATDGDNTSFIIENAAGAGNIIGDTIEEIADIVKNVNSDRVKVLIDTAHAFESGYDLRDKFVLQDFILQFDDQIGLDNLVGFHLNDSKTDLNSRRDRHADIGYGFLGMKTFENLVNHESLKDKFGILETPQDESSWVEQIKILKNMGKR